MLKAYAREEPLSHPRVVITGISGSRMEDMPRPQQSPPSAQLVRSVGVSDARHQTALGLAGDTRRDCHGLRCVGGSGATR